MASMAKSCLGIALANRSVAVAELCHTGSSFRLAHANNFIFADDDDWQEPAKLGAKFVAFLKAHGFTTTQAIMGLPAQWLLFKEKSLPPAKPEALKNIILLQLERDFSLEPEQLLVDYLSKFEGHSKTPGEAGQPVLLAATMRFRLEQVKLFAEAAGLRLKAVTPTGLALAMASGDNSHIYCGGNEIEMLAPSASGLPCLRHLANNQANANAFHWDAPQIASEISRAQAMGLAIDAKAGLPVWADCDLPIDSLSQMSNALGLPLSKRDNFRANPIEGVGDSKAAAAVALALRHFQADVPGIDLAHSKLDAKEKRKLGAQTVWGAIAAAAVLLGIGYLLYDWHCAATDVAEQLRKRDEMKAGAASTLDFINMVTSARGWFDDRPAYLECMLAITLCFPEEGKSWDSSLTLKEDMSGTLLGRASDEKAVLDVLDKIRSIPGFTHVKMLHMRGVGGRSADLSFGIGFSFTGRGKP